MLSLDNLQIFITAAETENFSRAAQQLHISQPAVSQHIQALEQQLGVLLFERHGRRIRLSTAGQALLPLVRGLIRNSQQVEAAALALAGEVAGHLVIGCSTTSGKYVLPPLLARYREQYPLVRAIVKVGSRSQVIGWLLAGEVGLAAASERVRRGGLRYRRFFEDEVVMIVPAAHPWAQRTRVLPQELYQERFILSGPASGTHMTLLEGLENIDVDASRLETVLVLENSEAIIVAVEEGIGLGFVPLVAARRCLALDRIRVVPVEGLVTRRWLYLVHNGRRPQTSALGAFWDFVDETLPEGRLPRVGSAGQSVASTNGKRGDSGVKAADQLQLEMES